MNINNPNEGDNTLYMTVGLPRVGKLEWAMTQGVPVVCPDSIRIALHGRAYIQSAEPYVWAIARTMVASLFEAGHRRVILVACNITRKRRDEWRGPWLRVFADFAGRAPVLNGETAGVIDAAARMSAVFEPVGADEGSCLHALS